MRGSPCEVRVKIYFLARVQRICGEERDDVILPMCVICQSHDFPPYFTSLVCEG